MEFNIRRDGQWENAPVRIRRNGAWELISEDDGDPPDLEGDFLDDGELGYNMYYLGGPPERTGDTLYVPDNYSTIQEAVDAVSNDETILIAPGTYREDIDLNDVDANHWSMIGAGSYPEDVEIRRDSRSVMNAASMPDFGAETQLRRTIEETEVEELGYVPVESSSGFEAGMDIRIHNREQMMWDMWYSDPDTTGITEWHTIDSVDDDNDRLYVEEDIGIVHLWTDDLDNTEVSEVHWNLNDVHFANFRMSGDRGHSGYDRGDNMIARPKGWKNIWWTDVDFVQGGDSGIQAEQNWYWRMDNCYAADAEDGSRGYGFNMASVQVFYGRNLVAEDLNAYGLKSGGGPKDYAGSWKNRWDDCEVYRVNNYATDCHEGVRHTEFHRIYAEDTNGLGRISSPQQCYYDCHGRNFDSRPFRVTKPVFGCKFWDIYCDGSARGSTMHFVRFETDDNEKPSRDFDVRRWTNNYDSNFSDDSDVGSITFVVSGDRDINFEGDFIAEDWAWPVSNVVDKFEDIDHLCSYAGGDGCENIEEGGLDYRTTDWEPPEEPPDWSPGA